MHFLLPPALFALAVALGGLVTAYLLRARFRKRPVSNLMLWNALAPASGGGRSRDRLRTPPLFFLEFALLAAIALAAAMPYLRRGTPPAPTLVLDVSASMTARDPSGTTPSRRAAESLPRHIGDAPLVRVVLAGVPAPQPLGLLPRDEALALMRDPARFDAPSDTLDSALALAETLRAGDGALFVVTDRPPPPGRDLPAGSHWLAFGRPLSNAALDARRALAADGSESLLVSLRRLPAAAGPLPVLIEPTNGAALPLPHNVQVSPTEPEAIPLPPNTPTLRISLPDDALAFDNEAVLPSAVPPPAPVECAVADPALLALVRRAVSASGLGAPEGASPSNGRTVLVTDDAERLRTHRGPALLLVTPQATKEGDSATRLLAGPWLADGADPLLEGVDFTGLAWPLPPVGIPSPLPGRPVVWCVDTPVVSALTPDIHALLVPPAASPFFRSTAWPSLICNLLASAQPPPEESAPNHALSGSESDLTGCDTLSLAGPPAPPPEDRSAIRPLAPWLGIAALMLLAVRLALLTHGGRRFPRIRLAIDIAAVLLLVAAIANPALRIPRRGGTIVVIADRSASLPQTERQAQASLVGAVDARRAEGQSLAVVSFGEHAIVEQPPTEAAFPGLRADPGADASDLDAAMDTALALVPPREPARLLVLSDGLATGTDPLGSAIRRAAARGIPVDVRMQSAPRADDMAIVRVDAPPELRSNAPLLATAWVSCPKPQSVAYTLLRDGEPIARGTVELPAGLTPLRFRDDPRPEGVSAYAVSVMPTDATPDPVPENNTARFLVTRSGARPLCVVPATPESRLPALLRGAGLDIVVREPRDIPSTPAALAAWSGLLIENRRADAFGIPTLRAIAAWVEHAGGGLALTGGRNAFGPGGWHRTPVEDILPVSLELRREHRKFPMAIAVVLDRSGSMAAPAGHGARTKMDLADLATAEVLDMLADDDQIAVIAVDSAPHTVVPLRDAAQARDDRKRILAIESMGGGIFVGEGLVAGLAELRKSTAPIRHLILFADAADAEEPGNYLELLAAARDAGITVSVVGLGTEHDSDAALLAEVAERGGGQCLFSDDAHEIPRLFAQDTMLVARDIMVTNPVLPRFTAALPQLSDRLPLTGAPAVGGYDLTYLRPDATAVALVDDENTAPLVALRPVGAGRSIVFTGEADGELAGPFARWEHAAEFHAAIARFAAGDASAALAGHLVLPRLGPASLDIAVYPADTPWGTAGGALRPLRLFALRTRPNGETTREEVNLEWTAPDRLEARIPLRGAETVLPVLADSTTGAVRPLPAARLPYPPEYAPSDDGRGEALLAAMADATGGRRLADPADVWGFLPKAHRPLGLAPLLYLLAALLVLIDIFDARTGFLVYNVNRGIRETRETPSDSHHVGRGASGELHTEFAKGKNLAGSAEKETHKTGAKGVKGQNHAEGAKGAEEHPSRESVFERAHQRAASRTRRK